ncbi:MAG: hypothetical protein HY645_13565 [Acidobacteria bacterium]|nr:hypothetical protein [Acidobacteriota bacterium]
MLKTESIQQPVSWLQLLPPLDRPKHPELRAGLRLHEEAIQRLVRKWDEEGIRWHEEQIEILQSAHVANCVVEDLNIAGIPAAQFARVPVFPGSREPQVVYSHGDDGWLVTRLEDSKILPPDEGLEILDRVRRQSGYPIPAVYVAEEITLLPLRREKSLGQVIKETADQVGGMMNGTVAVAAFAGAVLSSAASSLLMVATTCPLILVCVGEWGHLLSIYKFDLPAPEKMSQRLRRLSSTKTWRSTKASDTTK